MVTEISNKEKFNEKKKMKKRRPPTTDEQKFYRNSVFLDDLR